MANPEKPSFLFSVIVRVGSGISGGCASIITDTIYFPLDSIKTRIQASGTDKNFQVEAKNVNKLKGLIPSLLSSFPAAFGFFFSYELAKKVQTEKFQSPDGPKIHLLAAACGETTAALIRNPFEVVKQQMQIGLESNTRATARAIFNAKGIRGFYAGLDSLILREIPFSCIQFPIYEYFKKQALQRNQGKELSFTQSSQNGALAGSIAGFLTTPIDVAKTKLMTQKNNYYKNLPDTLSKIYRDEGFSKLFSAFHIRVFNLAFGGIVFFGAYESVRSRIVGNPISH